MPTTPRGCVTAAMTPSWWGNLLSRHPMPARHSSHCEEVDAMRWLLPPNRVPSAWRNVAPDLAQPMEPPLHPATRNPLGPDDLAPLFPMALIAQEVAAEPWIDVPGEVLDVL